MEGRATFTTETSRTTMNWATQAMARMIQSGAWRRPLAGAVLIAPGLAQGGSASCRSGAEDVQGVDREVPGDPEGGGDEHGRHQHPAPRGDPPDAGAADGVERPGGPGPDEQREHDHEQGIAPEGGPEVAVEKRVQGPGRAADRAPQPGQLVEGAGRGLAPVGVEHGGGGAHPQGCGG